MHKRFIPFLILILASILVQVTVHLINLRALEKDHPQALRNAITIRTADDASYLNPPLNYLEKGQWKTSQPGVQSHFERPPGYGLIWMTMNLMAGKGNALIMLVALQVLLHAMAAVCMMACIVTGIPTDYIE